MSAIIYSPPKELKEPEFSFENFDYKEHQKKSQKYLDDLKAILVKSGYTDKLCGETIRFPVADGYAVYMIASMKPLKLIHIPLDDAWDFPQAHLLTATEVKKMIEQDKAMKKLFGNGDNN